MTTNGKIRAVEMVRKIRDRHARVLARKTSTEVIAFYHAAGEMAVKAARSRKTRIPKAR